MNLKREVDIKVELSLTHHVALLVPLSGPIHPVVDRRGLTGSERPPIKADLAIYSPMNGVYV